MEVAPLDTRTMTKDQWWDWGSAMYEALEKSRVSGRRFRVYGVHTGYGWHYRMAGTSSTGGER